MISLKANLILY